MHSGKIFTVDTSSLTPEKLVLWETNIQQMLKDEIKKQHLEVLYPIAEKAYFDPRFLVRCLIEGIYPMGFPLTGKHNVHNTEVNQAAFAMHDFAHFSTDQRIEALTEYVAEEAIKIISVKSAIDFTAPLVSLAFEKYRLIMSTLEDVYEKLKQDSVAMTGFFWWMHESPKFEESFFKKFDIKDLFDSIEQSTSSKHEIEETSIQKSEKINKPDWPNDDKKLFEWTIKNATQNQVAQLDQLISPEQFISHCTTHFVTQAKAHLSEKSAESGKSKADIFAEKFWEIDKKIEALKKAAQ
ncbi:MAG: hypothetical protein ACRC4G_01510 [Alphaproteobacteria bacterium]